MKNIISVAAVVTLPLWFWPLCLYILIGALYDVATKQDDEGEYEFL